MTNEFIAHYVEPTVEQIGYCREYDEVWNLAKKLGCRFYTGASRMALVFSDDDEVIKMPRVSDCSMDYCAKELENYERAKEFGIEKVLLPIRKYYGPYDNGMSIYVQKKFSFDYCGSRRDWLDKKTHSLAFTRATRCDDFWEIMRSTYQCRVPSNWFAFMYLYYGKNFCKRFAKWTQVCKVNDLHNGNVGFLKGKPIVLDYAGYFD